MKFKGLRYVVSKLLISTRAGRTLLRKLPYYDQRRFKTGKMQQYLRSERIEAIITCGLNDLMDITYQQKLGIPIIQMFHQPPPVFFENKKFDRIETLVNCLRQVTVAQILLPEYAATLAPYYQGPVHSIGNAVVAPSPITAVRVAGKQRIVYLARLVSGKQQDLLIRAFAGLAARHPQWSVHLFGVADNTAYEKSLQRLIRQFSLEDQVFLRGFISQPWVELASADVCAFPSSSEGFPLGLAEAMCVGLPCIGLQSCTGVNTLLQHRVTGLLVDGTAAAFAAGLEELMTVPDLRRTLGRNAKDYIRNYSPDQIWGQWDALLQQVLHAQTSAPMATCPA